MPFPSTGSTVSMRFVVAGMLAIVVMGGSWMVWHDETRPGSNDGIRVVSGTDAAFPAASVRTPQEPASMPPANFDMASDDVRGFVASSFPSLRDVTAQCQDGHCDISAVATVPPGGGQLSSYEEMIRNGLESTLRRHGYSLVDAIQIEEVSGDEVRLRIRTTA